MKRKIVYFILILTMLVAAGCQSGSATADSKETIKLADTQFQSLWINNAIAAFIIENGFEYPVETVEMTTPVAQKSLEEGDVDIWMELWRANWLDHYNEIIESGAIIDLGPTYERSAQGWYVPRYVIDGDPERGLEPLAPDLKSVDDLPLYKELFADPEEPEKGLFVSCITGWQCAAINEVKIHAYGLDETYNILEPGSSGALDAAIAGAYKKGDPIFAYYWEPTWLIGLYDMVMLEEPAYTDACWEEMKLSQGDERTVSLEDVQPSAGCAYETLAIHKGVNSSLAERAPDLVDFLEKLDITTAGLNRAAAYMTAEEATADEAAVWYLREYEDLWKTWVPEDVALKVSEALAEAE
jgi:glycine betaine/proline transport system substrate-binding protein